MPSGSAYAEAPSVDGVVDGVVVDGLGSVVPPTDGPRPARASCWWSRIHVPPAPDLRPGGEHRDHNTKREYHHDHDPGDEASAFDDRAVGFGGGDRSVSGIGCPFARYDALGCPAVALG